MPVTTAVAIFFLIWWVVLFAVLPWGVRSQHEGGEIAPGTDPGAPAIPHLGRKLLWTTLVSARDLCRLLRGLCRSAGDARRALRAVRACA